MNRSPRSLRFGLAHAAFRSVVLTGAILAGLSWNSLAEQAQVRSVTPDSAHSVPSPTEKLVKANGCWTGEAPADMTGKIPGHVVVTVKGETRLGGPRLVGKSLEQIFEGAQHGLYVHAFCR